MGIMAISLLASIACLCETIMSSKQYRKWTGNRISKEKKEYVVFCTIPAQVSIRLHKLFWQFKTCSYCTCKALPLPQNEYESGGGGGGGG